MVRMMLVAWVVCGVAGTAWGQGVLHVDRGLQTGAGDGSSWAAAFRGPGALVDALGAAQPGDEVWVAGGVYTPTTAPDEPLASFTLVEGVGVYGGFAGGETARSERDPALNVTILSGDNLADDGVGPLGGVQDNAIHVVRGVGVGSGAVVDGFTITRGDARSRSGGVSVDVRAGGGMLLENTSVVVRNCVFVENRAGRLGSGAAVLGGAPVFEGCRFDAPNVFAGGGIGIGEGASVMISGCVFQEADAAVNSVRGAGVAVGHSGVNNDPTPGHAVIVDCLFSISSTGAAGNGIGVHVNEGATAEIRGCDFIGNTHVGSGGGVSCDGVCTIDRCRFIGNEAQGDGGAAIYGLGGDVTITNSLFEDNARHTGSTLAMLGRNFGGAPGTLRVINCTIVDNGSPTLGHAVFFTQAASNLIVRNTVIAELAVSGTPEDALYIPIVGVGTVLFDRCCIEGWGGQWPGVGTFDADPLFAGPGDYRLGPGSPCIDAADNGALDPALMLDLGGGPRFLDDPATLDTGVGPGPIADIGAYEYAPVNICAADFDGDGDVDLSDFGVLGAAFGSVTGDANYNAAADFDGDGDVDLSDFGVFGSEFGRADCLSGA